MDAEFYLVDILMFQNQIKNKNNKNKLICFNFLEF